MKTDCGDGSHLPQLRAVRASPSPLPQRLLPVARSSVAPYCAFPRINDAGSNAFPHLCATGSDAFHRTDAAGSTAYPSSTPLVLSTPGRAAALSPLLDVKRSAALRVRIQSAPTLWELRHRLPPPIIRRIKKTHQEHIYNALVAMADPAPPSPSSSAREVQAVQGGFWSREEQSTAPPSFDCWRFHQPATVRSQQSCTDKKSRIKVLRPQSARSLQLNTQSERSSHARFKVLRTLSAPSPSRFQLNTQSERSSPARFKVYPQSESCGSSPASGSMELEYEIFPSVSMDLRRRILLSLYTIKFANYGDDQWRATDPSVLTNVQKFLKVVKLDLSIDEIKEQVIAMEDDVKLDMARVKQISEDRDSYLLVFNYVMPEFVQDSPPTDVLATVVIPEFAQDSPPTDVLATAVMPEIVQDAPPTDVLATVNVASEPHSQEFFTSNRKKMKTTCNPDCSTSSFQSDSSIGEQFSKLMEDKDIAINFFRGPMSMENCTDKVKRCGFKGNELLRVLKLLRLNWEHRQIFMKLEDSEAKAYALDAIYES